jgi:hypothetical protein
MAIRNTEMKVSNDFFSWKCEELYDMTSSPIPEYCFTSDSFGCNAEDPFYSFHHM